MQSTVLTVLHFHMLTTKVLFIFIQKDDNRVLIEEAAVFVRVEHEIKSLVVPTTVQYNRKPYNCLANVAQT